VNALVSALSNPQDAHFWAFIALVVFVIVLWRIEAHSTVGKALDAVGEKVRAQLDEAVKLREEAEALLAHIKTQREETEQLAAQMLAAAEADAERLRVEAAAKLEEDIKRRGELATRKIAIAEAQAASEVKAAAADLAAQAAEAVLTARVAGAKTDPLIDAGLAGLARRFS
jgi:F-type H+-transporting ATPase subunit b